MQEFYDDVMDEISDGVTSDVLESQFDLDEHGYETADDLVQDMQDEGYKIDRGDAGDEFIYKLDDSVDDQLRWQEDDGTYRFAIISDTHLGSEAEQLDQLNDFYDRMAEEDIEIAFHAGDISDGTVKNNGRGVYRGHSNHLKPEAIGWNRLEDYVVENYPDRDDIDTFFISGNHDHQLFKNTGIRFGENIDRRRDDLHWIGDSYANVELDEDLDMDLVHPSGGTPYTLGYRAQTWLRDKPEEEKADITIFGHLHQFLNAETEGSEVLYAGAWQGSTPFLERKGIKPKAGGWIVEMDVDDDGDIERWQTERVTYELEGDSDVSADELSEMLEG